LLTMRLTSTQGEEINSSPVLWGSLQQHGSRFRKAGGMVARRLGAASLEINESTS